VYPVATFVAVTVEPGNALPLSSSTVPRIVAVVVCATAGETARTSNIKRHIH
jgi:hypothetical protein